MRRNMRFTQERPARPTTNSTMSRELDWLLEQWRTSSPEVRQQLLLAKIRQEEKNSQNPGR